MIIRWLSFGRSLAKGIGHYQRGAYTEALDALNAAVKIKESDFLVQFWLLRTSVRLGRREDAGRYAANCMSWRADLAELISPWQQAAKGETMSDDGLAGLDAAADRLLAYHQWEDKPISLSRVASMFGLWLGLLMLISVVYNLGKYLIFSISPVTPAPIQDVLYYALIFKTLSILLYWKYFWRPNIHTNGWLIFRRHVALAFSVMRNRAFIRLYVEVVLFIITLIIIRKWGGNDLYPQEYFQFPIIQIILLLILGPISEELIFRKVLFTYLRQYSSLGAYIFVALAYYLFHDISSSGIWHFVASIFMCLVYEQQNTIIAPMILHFLINFVMLINIYIFLHSREYWIKPRQHSIFCAQAVEPSWAVGIDQQEQGGSTTVTFSKDCFIVRTTIDSRG
ncbi:CPBP family intramembrane glutamic endopeptidase [Methylomusa anaerophila]|uniref:CAAX amino terminal protease self-immunity n=1 Tax=Methylomusa anaerophila TaxID=1930071 RepID=A0A348AI96_9FIRM|nr:type II CAAX endopeptidase family protein [Methylomusa anaerophila]BBB90794.1 CAAX amino terminal protease self- immunity [Methylomusa anaerophila]